LHKEGSFVEERFIAQRGLERIMQEYEDDEDHVPAEAAAAAAAAEE
jgi:hypothetical protein